MKIPVYEPILNEGNEGKYLQQCIKKNWVSSEGYFVQKFEEEFAKWSGNKYAIAVCNGTAALETALWAMKIFNSNVALTTSTIISPYLALRRLSNKVYFTDLYNGANLPIQLLQAQMPMHLFGVYDYFNTRLTAIEDASQYWKPFKVKDVACYSLYANKLITSGEGGILITNKKEVYERAKSYRNLCHSKERFIHNDMGYNFRMSNLQAAVALAQLEQIDKFTEIKLRNRDLYMKYLPNKDEGVICWFEGGIPWMYLIQTNFNAGDMVRRLYQKGIECRRFFYPLHKQPCLTNKYAYLNFPNSERAWKHRFYLPSGLTLTEKQVRYVCQSLRRIMQSITT